MGTSIDVTLHERGADAARVDLLHRQFRQELRHVDAVDVVPSPGQRPGPVEPGARGLDPETMNALAVAVIGSGGLAGLISSLRAWLGRASEETRSVRLEISGDVIELSGATSVEQEDLLRIFLARHGAPPP
ncbi:effector-associated constant component EACC1 [Terrabacter sp. Soil811]|uniref:effector-associated constant component EACC1 n=1 Tax=Terrabacter sp. Soil811 TaxID=1736419 RepID=UPI000A5BDEB8|nr:hypothetical protein [Terrabacter sp. Soil811]